ncbi:NAD(P) transhydrogenase subunit alpha [Mycobacterium tuberculosis]|nr:NAD(P) transhydrogenase subunit alpha [Mycobacterium tuberculosis]
MTDPQTQSTRVGVVAESGPDERRVALVPKAVASLVNRGVAVVVEAGAGERALLPDELYTAVGASIGDAWAADGGGGRPVARWADTDRLSSAP